MKKSVAIVLMSIAFNSTAIISQGQTMATGENLKKNQIAVKKQEQQKSMGAAKNTKTVYTCPMHPEVTGNKTGKCPKCKMNLVQKDAKIFVYTCPMHSEVKMNKQGKCPKCGMNLVKKETKQVNPAHNM